MEPRLTGWRLKLSKCFLIPQRVVFVIMVTLGIFNCYTMRVCLNIGITGMEVSVRHVKLGPMQFDWNTKQQGHIKSAFYYGYVVSHMPGGIMAEYYGGKHVFGIGLLSTVILTLLTPLVAIWFNFIGVVAMRVLIGIGEGVTFPALTSLLSEWVPVRERSRLGTLAFSGIILGTITANALSGWLMSFTKRWDVVFYLFGLIGIATYIAYQLLVYSYPVTHPFISDKELEFLTNEIGNRQSKKLSEIPWKGILTNVPMWSLVIAQIGHDWGLFTVINDLPNYLKAVLKFSVKNNGLLSALPHLFMWSVAITSAILCDWLIKKNKFSIGVLRKFFTTIAGAGPGLFLVLASYSGCNRMLAVVFFCAALGTMGCYYPGMRVNALDLSHNYAGIMMALINGMGTISGIVSPVLIGYITSHATLSEWRILFWITFGILVVSVIIYIILGSGKVQDFDDPNYVFPGCCKKKKQAE